MSTPTLMMTNFASGTLAQAISISDTTILLNPGEGAAFPQVTGTGDRACLVIEDVAANKELVYLTAITGDTLTVERAQENTIARAFGAGSRVENRMTAGTIAMIDSGTF